MAVLIWGGGRLTWQEPSEGCRLVLLLLLLLLMVMMMMVMMMIVSINSAQPWLLLVPFDRSLRSTTWAAAAMRTLTAHTACYSRQDI